MDVGKPSPEFTPLAHFHWASIKDPLSQPRLQGWASQLNPVFCPSAIRVWAVSVPAPWQEQKYRACFQRVLRIPKFQSSTSLRYRQQLKCRKNPPAFPGKIMPFRMSAQRIGMPGRDTRMTDRRDAKCPVRLSRAHRIVLKIVLDRFLHATESPLHASRDDIRQRSVHYGRSMNTCPRSLQPA